MKTTKAEGIATNQKAAKHSVSGMVGIPLANHQRYNAVMKSITKASRIKAESYVTRVKMDRSPRIPGDWTD